MTVPTKEGRVTILVIYKKSAYYKLCYIDVVSFKVVCIWIIIGL